MQLNKNSNTIIGAIIGDIAGSYYEWKNTKTKDFEFFVETATFTDNTVLTVAVADIILNNKDIAKTIQQHATEHKNRGFGHSFRKWRKSKDLKPYNSWGNGSAMRVSPVGFAFNTMEEVLQKAKETAEVTHNHPEGIKGAQAVASAVFLARTGKSKNEIKDFITRKFDYNLNDTLDNIRPTYKFDVSCQGSVPQAIIAFLEGTDYEDTIRNAISIGGDSDTIACIAGGIATAFYGKIPEKMIEYVNKDLPENFIKIINEFDDKYTNKHIEN